MSAQFMRRNIRISVRLTEEEHRLLKEKMGRIGVTNQEAFLRKMALDGLVIKLDLPELKQMISLLRYTSNNINQIAKRLNESGRAYKTDFADILEKQEQLWGLANEILMKLSAIR
ncbi:MAG: plasmid mobilization protein [Eubacteriales bacterium]|jgi:predicted DNA binding CopG/RHH family protein